MAIREEVRADLTAFREEMREELQLYRKESRQDMGELRVEMGELRAEMGALNRTTRQFMFAIVGTIFLGFMGTISALATLT